MIYGISSAAIAGILSLTPVVNIGNAIFCAAWAVCALGTTNILTHEQILI